MTTKFTPRLAIITGVSALALMIGPQIANHVGAGPIGVAHAQESGGSQGHRGQGGQGGQGSQGAGHRGGQGAGTSEGSSGGQGGPSADSDAKGPKYGGGAGTTGSHGGKPVWAQEGVSSDVELGRLSVVRSPDKVIARALEEAVTNFDAAKLAALYSMDAQSFADYVKANYSTITIVDSPLQNLGLYEDVLADGQTQLSSVTPKTTIDLAAIFLGSASDKTIPVTRDTVIAVDTILGLPQMTDAQIDLLAAKAEIVRQAILEGHGE